MIIARNTRTVDQRNNPRLIHHRAYEVKDDTGAVHSGYVCAHIAGALNGAWWVEVDGECVAMNLNTEREAAEEMLRAIAQRPLNVSQIVKSKPGAKFDAVSYIGS